MEFFGFVEIVTFFGCRVDLGSKGRNRITIDIFCYILWMPSIDIPARRALLLEWGMSRNLSMPLLSIEVLAALGSTLKKELIDFGVSLWLLR